MATDISIPDSDFDNSQNFSIDIFTIQQSFVINTHVGGVVWSCDDL